MRAFKNILGFTMIIVAISCSEDVAPKPFTFSKKITGENNKTWKIKFFEETLNGEVEDTFTVGCTSDDQYVFYANSERLMEVKSGASKCFVDPEPAIQTDTWSYNSGTATLTMLFPIFADFSLPFIVRDLSDDDMEIEIFIDAENTASYRIHFDAIDEE